jgi:hypothetical protein
MYIVCIGVNPSRPSSDMISSAQSSINPSRSSQSLVNPSRPSPEAQSSQYADRAGPSHRHIF